jgi:PKD repeat protein
MIRPRDKVKLFIQGETYVTPEFPNGTWDYEDYTDKLLTISSVRGVDKFTGLGQQSDTGQLSIVSSSTDLDPYTNAAIRSGKRIIISYEDVDNPIFTGNISNINIEYRPKDDPIITINAIDGIGQLSNSLFYNDPNLNISPYYAFREILWSAYYLYRDPVPGPSNVSEFLDPIGFAAIVPADQAYEQILKGATGRMGFIFTDKYNSVTYYDYEKYLTIDNAPVSYFTGDSPRFRLTETNEEQNERPYIIFDSEGIDGYGYKSINIDDGFDRILNQVEITTTSSLYTEKIPDPQFPDFDIYVNNVREDSEWPIFEKQSSIDEWGIFSGSIETYIPDDLSFDLETTEPVDKEVLINKIARDYLESESAPGREVISITFDATKYPELANEIDLYYSNVTVKHKVNESFTIDSDYKVVGIKNEIDESNWLVELALRPIMNAADMGPKPTLTYTASDTNHDTRTVYTFTVDSSEEMTGISWIWNLPGENFEPDAFWIKYVKQTAPNQIQVIFPQPVGELNVSEPGYYIAAVVEYENGWKRATNSAIFDNIVKEQPVSDFSYVANQPEQTFSFTFTGKELEFYYNDDADAGPVTAIFENVEQDYLWDFGDGTTSTEKNPVKIYSVTEPGTYNYNVSLTVTTAFGDSDTYQETVTMIIPVVPQAEAIFSFVNNSPDVLFNNQSIYADTFLWNFGDGNTSTLENPTHRYEELGTYTVTLTASNINNSDTTTRTVVIDSVFMPIRYLKFEWDIEQISSGVSSGGSRIYDNSVIHIVYEIEVENLSGQNVAFGKSVQAIDKPINSFPRWEQFTWNSSISITSGDPWDNSGPNYLTDGKPTSPITFPFTGAQVRSNTTTIGGVATRTYRGDLILDIGSSIKNINSVFINAARTGDAPSAPSEPVNVYASSDNNVWNLIGTIRQNVSGQPNNLMVPVASMPPRLES